jgi:hypothetical protein
MKPVHFTNTPSTQHTWATQTVVMDDGTVWIRYLNVKVEQDKLDWCAWIRVKLPTDADLITAEEE